MTENINGKQFIADIWFKDSFPDLDSFAKFVIDGLKLKVVKKDSHNFYPGETIVYILSESHFIIHTYPEYNYLGIDIYSCGGQKLSKLEEIIKENYNIDNIKVWELERGNYQDQN